VITASSSKPEVSISNAMGESSESLIEEIDDEFILESFS
jgi:hypothetical protein